MQELYEMICDHAAGLQAELNDLNNENEYLMSFIHYHVLDKEYEEFRKKAYKETDEDNPFPCYTVD